MCGSLLALNERMASLDAPLDIDPMLSVGESLADETSIPPDVRLEHRRSKRRSEHWLGQLSEPAAQRDRAPLRTERLEICTLEQLAKDLNLTRERVRQIQLEALSQPAADAAPGRAVQGRSASRESLHLERAQTPAHQAAQQLQLGCAGVTIAQAHIELRDGLDLAREPPGAQRSPGARNRSDPSEAVSWQARAGEHPAESGGRRAGSGPAPRHAAGAGSAAASTNATVPPTHIRSTMPGFAR